MDQAFDYLVMDLSLLTGDIGAFLIDRTDQMCVVVDPSPQGIARAGHSVSCAAAQVLPTAIGICVNRVNDSTPARRSQPRPQVLTYLGDQPQTVAGRVQGPHAHRTAPGRRARGGFADLSRTFIQRAFRTAPKPRRNRAARRPPSAPRPQAAILRRLIEEIDLRKGDLGYLHDPVKRQEMHVRVEGKLVALVQEEATDVTRQDRRQLVKELMDEALGLGPLEDLLEDPSVTEIMVNRSTRCTSSARAPSPSATSASSATTSCAASSSASSRRSVGASTRRCRWWTRGCATAAASTRSSRRWPSRAGDHDPQVLEEAARHPRSDRLRLDDRADRDVPRRRGPRRQNIVIFGGTGSGKTTLLNVLSSFIPDDERIVTSRTRRSCSCRRSMSSRSSRGRRTSKARAPSPSATSRNSLRMRPDRIVVGECRGGEALDMLQAMNTGHDGFRHDAARQHPVDALSRLETLSLMAGLDLPARAIRDGSRRRCDRRAAVVAAGRQPSHHLRDRDLRPGRRAVRDPRHLPVRADRADARRQGDRQFRPTGHVPAFVKNLPNFGIQVPEEIFLHQTP